jgi:hypothetical protein
MPPILEHEIFKRPNGRWGIRWRDTAGNYSETEADATALFIDTQARLQQIESGRFEGFDRGPGRPVTMKETRTSFPLMLTATEKQEAMFAAKAKGMSLSGYLRWLLLQQNLPKD